MENLTLEATDSIDDRISAELLAAVDKLVEMRIDELLGANIALSEDQAAKALQCSPSSLYRARRNRRISYSLNPAGRAVYCKADLLEYLNASRRTRLKGKGNGLD